MSNKKQTSQRCKAPQYLGEISHCSKSHRSILNQIMLLWKLLSRRVIPHSSQVAENYFPASSLSTSSAVHVRRLRSTQETSPVKEDEIDISGKSSNADLFVQELIVKEGPKTLLENSATHLDADPQGPKDIWSTGPYPRNSNFEQSQAKYSYRPPRIDPRETSLLLFPGQGTQYVGMAKELLKYPNVKEMYSIASEILGYDLLQMSINGPLKELSRTVHQQPAVVVASLAAVEKLRDERPSVLESCVGAAGFSIGEITALTFAGALSFEDAIRVVKVRAEAMQLASEMNASGMMTVLYGPDSRLGFACSVAKEFCQAKGLPMVDCRIANYLYPHCKVIAGNDEALEFIEKNKADFKLKRLKRLPVSGAFHTDLMQPAVPALKKVLEKIDINPPLIPVHSNLDGKSYKNAKQIKKLLPRQIFRPVKWEQTLHILYEREKGVFFPSTFECGPGKTLQTILKMVNAKAYDSCHSIAA